jgi:hypothetical protein
MEEQFNKLRSLEEKTSMDLFSSGLGLRGLLKKMIFPFLRPFLAPLVQLQHDQFQQTRQTMEMLHLQMQAQKLQHLELKQELIAEHREVANDLLARTDLLIQHFDQQVEQLAHDHLKLAEKIEQRTDNPTVASATAASATNELLEPLEEIDGLPVQLTKTLQTINQNFRRLNKLLYNAKEQSDSGEN